MKKTIGILGGMGPLATADLFRKIVLMTRASCDNEHIRIYIDNNCRIPDRTAAILQGGPDPVPEMSDALRHLEACGADCIIMPCNTAHYFLPRLQSQTRIPFLSMLEATAKACAARFPGKTACVLATRGTLASGLVRRPMEQLMDALTRRGADYFILGCTELPIVQQELALPGSFIDPTAELARAAILFCGYPLKD